MSIPLPKKISPNPLVTSTIEIRFVSTISEGEALSRIYPVFSEEFPNLGQGEIPQQLRQSGQEQFKYAPDYVMSNDRYSISFSNKVFIFNNIIAYPLWGEYFEFIKIQLKKILSLEILEGIERIGIRYISVFEGARRMEEIFKKVPLMSLESDYEEQLNLFRSFIKKGDFNLMLQIAKNAKVTRQKTIINGLLIDIDSSSTVIKNNEEELIDSLHTEQKKLFFSILKEDFIASLNPEY